MIMSSFKRIAITNRHLCGRSLPEQVNLIGASIDCLILREKDLDKTEYELLARDVQETCHNQGVDLICHTFTRAARKIGCKRIHLTYRDFIKQREALEDFDCIGVSAHCLEEIQFAEAAGADYVTISPIFETACKEGVRGKGLDYLKEVCEQTSISVYALGGIDEENEKAVRLAGAAGACRMSDYMR